MPQVLTGSQKLLMQRAALLAELQMEHADELLGQIGRTQDDAINKRLRVALMQVLATNYAAEVDKRKD
jgi:hypothetical protein